MISVVSLTIPSNLFILTTIFFKRDIYIRNDNLRGLGKPSARKKEGTDIVRGLGVRPVRFNFWHCQYWRAEVDSGWGSKWGRWALDGYYTCLMCM